MNGGSSHSSASTRGRGSAPRTAIFTRSSRSASSRTRSTPASFESVACARVRMSPITSPIVDGSSEITSGCEGSRSATARTSSNDTAHTWHSACVTIRSGSSSASSSSSSS